jgi:hypothetical protein
MNVFTTDHPMMSEPSPALLRLRRRLLKGFVVGLLGYPLYLLLLGPFWGLDGRGVLDFFPVGIRDVCYMPCGPIWMIPHLRGRYADYLDWWYLDPNAADRETGWD